MEFKVIRNDIVNMDVDAIVLPANPSLKEGPGASKAIFQAAGRKQLISACDRIIKKKGKIKVGSAVPTLGYNLDATYIIHAIVPRWNGGKNNEYELLSSTYCSILKLADMLGCSSLAIPLLASGNNKFDINLAIEVAIKSIESYDAENKLTDVFIVVYDMISSEKIRRMNLPFEETIDEAYVMEQAEKNILKKGTKRSTKRSAKHVAKKYLDEIIDQSVDFFTDSDNIEAIVKKGFDIAKMILK